MQVVIFGASGKTGKHLVEQALEAGHVVTAFARDTSNLESQSMRVVRGDVTDPVAVGHAMEGQEAVLCALGQASPFKRDPRLSLGIKQILLAMEKAGTRRLVYLSFAGVQAGRRHAGAVLNYLMVPLLSAVVADHEEREALIRLSPVDWTMVRAVRLTNGRATHHYRSGAYIRPHSPFPNISRADAAHLMLRVLEDTTTIHKGLQVMY